MIKKKKQKSPKTSGNYWNSFEIDKFGVVTRVENFNSRKHFKSVCFVVGKGAVNSEPRTWSSVMSCR